MKECSTRLIGAIRRMSEESRSKDGCVLLWCGVRARVAEEEGRFCCCCGEAGRAFHERREQGRQRADGSATTEAPPY